jgi:hypothetical protein
VTNVFANLSGKVCFSAGDLARQYGAEGPVEHFDGQGVSQIFAPCPMARLPWPQESTIYKRKEPALKPALVR